MVGNVQTEDFTRTAPLSAKARPYTLLTIPSDIRERIHVEPDRTCRGHPLRLPCHVPAIVCQHQSQFHEAY